MEGEMYRAERLFRETSLGNFCSYLPFTVNHSVKMTLKANRGIIVCGSCTHLIYQITHGFTYSPVPYWTIQKTLRDLDPWSTRFSTRLLPAERAGDLLRFSCMAARLLQAMRSGPSNASINPRLMRWIKAFTGSYCRAVTADAED
jgi:hypothetical protein